MGDEIKIDKAVFESRLLTLQSIWKDRKSTDAFNNVTSILSVMGKTEEGPYSKSLALHFWLLGYEFPATLILITQERVWVVTTAKKGMDFLICVSHIFCTSVARTNPLCVFLCSQTPRANAQRKDPVGDPSEGERRGGQ